MRAIEVMGRVDDQHQIYAQGPGEVYPLASYG